MPLKHIMTTEVVTVRPDEAFSHVEEKMRLNHIRHLPVIDQKRKLVGLITHRDLYRAASPRWTPNGYAFDKEQLDGFILDHWMTQDPARMHPDDSVIDAVKLMASLKYGCVPIVEGDGTLAGIVTQVDLLKFLAVYLDQLK